MFSCIMNMIMENSNSTNSQQSLQQVGNYNIQSPSVTTNTNMVITSTISPSDNKPKLFIIVAILVTIIFWIGVGYLYITNQNLKEKVTKSQNLNIAPSQSSTPSSTPLDEQISIAGGNIVRKNENGEITILVNKSDYPSTGITGFLRVSVSYDNNLMCFESRSPANKPALYIADVNGGNVVEVSANKINCLWAKSSQGIFYTDTPITTNPVDIYMYDIFTKTETNLTQTVKPPSGTRQFALVSISDNGLITCTFKDFNNKTQEEVNSGNCTIDISGENPVYSEE
ncbi:MAG: hypothetical protein NZM26_05560 [Patescibacteria group bacterium]|nr:hypothetical protein [Patescibacteria group bacterium]